jgi:hypothetical protein
MYMCRLRHINDPVLSSLKMEGIRFFFSTIGRFAGIHFRNNAVELTRSSDFCHFSSFHDGY